MTAFERGKAGVWDVLKKALAMVLVLLLAAVCPGRLTVKAQDAPSVSAKAAVVLCADNGEVLYSKNSEERLSMASTTKIMTALITLEEAQVENRQVTITQEMVAVEGSSMGLRAGNVVTLDTLAKGMLLSSGNDAANAAALAISGSQEAFAQRMNDKAAQIGMKNTNFVTPSGLDAEQHYSTAYDMALLAAYAMENADFAAITSQKNMTVDFIEPAQTYHLHNHNRLLSLYSGCIGVKTGFTKKSGRCLVSCAEREGVRLIAVTLNAPNDWNDHQLMLDYGFSQVQALLFDDSSTVLTVPVVGGNVQEINVVGGPAAQAVVAKEDAGKVERRIELPRFVYAPVREGQALGRVDYYLNGELIAFTSLQSAGNAEALQVEKGFWQKICDFFSGLFGG